MYIGFSTNDASVDVTTYARRWGIETGYRVKEGIRPKTRSSQIGARKFCFFYSILLYNVCVIANALIANESRIRNGLHPAMMISVLKV